MSLPVRTANPIVSILLQSILLLLLYCIVLNCIVVYCTVLYSNVLCRIVSYYSYNIIQYNTIQVPLIQQHSLIRYYNNYIVLCCLIKETLADIRPQVTTNQDNDLYSLRN